MKIVFPINLYQKLRAYVEAVDVEISGLGKISVENGTKITVEDIALLPQRSTAGTTQIKKKELGQFYDNIIKNEPDEYVKWRMWWHSHGKLDVFWSPGDIAEIDDYDTELPEHNWLLSFETNHKAEILTRIDIFAPVRCTIEDIPWDIDLADYGLMEEIKDEVTEKVEMFRVRKPVLPRYKRRRKPNGPVGVGSQTTVFNENKEIILPGGYEDPRYRFPYSNNPPIDGEEV